MYVSGLHSLYMAITACSNFACFSFLASLHHATIMSSIDNSLVLEAAPILILVLTLSLYSLEISVATANKPIRALIPEWEIQNQVRQGGLLGS